MRLVAHGIATPLGPADIAAAALAAGLSRAERLDDGPCLGAGEEAGGPVAHLVLPPGGSAAARCLDLLDLAWSEAQRAGAQPAVEAAFLCCPAADARRWPPGGSDDGADAPQDGDAVGAAAAEAVRRRCGLAPHRRHGHAAAAEVLVEAAALIGSGAARRVLIAAVETRTDAGSLAWLAAADRLRGPETPDGLSPGEAAAWWIVDGGAGGDRIAAGWRPAGGDAPRTLAARWRAAGEAAGGDGADWVDLTGEPWRDRAWGAVLAGLPRRPWLAHPDGWGDLGAAAGLCAASALLVAGGGTVWMLGEDGAAGAIAAAPLSGG